MKLNVYHPCLVTQRHSGLSVRANKPAWTLRPCQVRAVGGTSQSPIGAKAAQCPQVCGQLQRLHTVPTSQPTQQYSWAKPPPTVSWGCRVSPCSVLWSFQGPRVSSRGSRCWSLRPRRHCPVCWLCSATVSGTTISSALIGNIYNTISSASIGNIYNTIIGYLGHDPKVLTLAPYL